MEHRRLEVRQLVEQPDGEVRDDDRDVHEWEAARRDPVGERKHARTVMLRGRDGHPRHR